MKLKFRVLKETIFIILVFAIILFSLFLINQQTVNTSKSSKNAMQTTTAGVMEFPALTLCRQTDGEWKAVPASEYSLNENEGVFNPTTDSNINYKCFCQKGKVWNISRGCI